MKQNKRHELDTLFVKDDSFSYKSLRVLDNQKVQMQLGPDRSSLNYDNHDIKVEAIEFESENE
jgi:hypothetical protein